MPAAAVIPALLAYVNAAAVKTLVVGVESLSLQFRKKCANNGFFVVNVVKSTFAVKP